MAYTHQLRVRFNECDQQGVVFNANHLVYADVACNELWRDELGGYHEFLERGLDVVVAEANLRYLAGARFDELLDIVVTVPHLGTTSFSLRSSITRADEPVADVVVRYVCVTAGDGGGKAPVPADLRERLERHLTPEPVAAS